MIKKILTTAMLGSAMVAASASADTLSYNFSQPLEFTEIIQTGSLGLFNSDLGVLTAVTLSLTGSSASDIELINNATTVQAISATATTDLNFSSGLSALDGLIGGPVPFISLSVTIGPLSIAPNADLLFGPMSLSSTKTLDAALAPIIGSFSAAGGGAFNVTCSSISGFTIDGGGGNIASNQTTQARCGATIEYTYTARPTGGRVPEPATLALLGLCAVGAGIARRKFA